MIYQLKRNPWNPIFIGSLAFCIFFIIIFIRYCLIVKNLHPIMIIESSIVPLIVAFAIKRFLIEVEFDFITNTLKTRSVLPFIRNTYDFNRIEIVKTVAISRGQAKTVDNVRLDNFVIKIKGKFQPQVYTVKNLEENEIVNQIINKWNVSQLSN